MHSLAGDLAGLEQLKDLLDRYNPIKYQSTEESRALAQEIPQAYGAVEETYKRFAGSSPVEVVDGHHKNVFANYFEAGYLSGRSFHVHEGYQELQRVIGRVKAEVARAASTDQSKTDPKAAWSLLHPKVQALAAERFNTGHFADSVEAVLKALNNEVRT